MRKTWLGGFVHEAENGAKTYVIRRQVSGKRYEVSTRCSTERAALKQLERFEADPENYEPGVDAPKKAAKVINLDQALATEFLTHCRDVKKNSASWLYQQKRYVAWWAAELAGVNLATASLKEHITPALAGQTARAHRIATIKALYAWLRTVKNEVTPAEDPTFGALMVPQAKAGNRAMKDKTIPVEDYQRARAHLTGHWLAAIDVQAGTGWHITEVKRFAISGAIEDHPMKADGVGGVLVCPEAKDGGMLRTPVSLKVREAAQDLLDRRAFDIDRYADAIREACEAVNAEIIANTKPGKVPKLMERFTPGRFRHTVGTWAVNNGNEPATVSAFLNHKDPRTLKRFYATHAVVTKIKTLI